MASLFGYVSDTELYYEEDEEPVVDQSVPCCSTDGAAGSGGATPEAAATPPPNPYVVLPAWMPGCTGGGTVATAADVTNSEDWST